MENAPLVEDDDSDDELSKKPVRPIRPKKQEAEVYDFFKFMRKEEKPEDDKPKKAEEAAAEAPVEAVIPATEAEAPLEELSDIEKPVIERELTLAAQQAEASQEAEATNNPEAVAADKAVEHFRELIIEDGEDSDAAMQHTLAELGSSPEEIDHELMELHSEEETPIELVPDDLSEQVPESNQEASEFGDGEVINLFSEAPEQPDEDEPDNATSQPANGAASVPPNPMPTYGAGGGQQPPNRRPFGLPQMPGRAPEDVPEVEVRMRGNPAAAALIGGVIGYLIGRRRGRIKTEKKLIPVQKKLEKQVYNLQWELQRKEDTIRKVAAEKVRTEGAQIINKLESVTEQTKQPEHIGHVLVSTAGVEMVRSSKSKEKRAPKTEATKQDLEQTVKGVQVQGKRVENLTRNELLSLSETISIEGSTLRQIYETRLVGERGLRRLVAEHLRGGNLSKALRREIVEREIDFERDPALRDFVPQDLPAKGGGGPSSLDKLLEKADININDGGEEVAFFRARAKYEATRHHKQQQQRDIVNIAFASIIIFLIGVVLVLIIAKT